MKTKVEVLLDEKIVEEINNKKLDSSKLINDLLILYFKIPSAEKKPVIIQNKNKFWNNFKGNMKNLGNSAGKVLENLEKQDKEMNERMKKILDSAK